MKTKIDYESEVYICEISELLQITSNVDSSDEPYCEAETASMVSNQYRAFIFKNNKVYGIFKID